MERWTSCEWMPSRRGKEKRDNSIRIPFSPGTFSTVSGGWLGGLQACSALLLRLASAQHDSTQTIAHREHRDERKSTLNIHWKDGY
ncbi:hypothetical protein CapIbe_004123 [Capra ibex]